MNVKSLNCEILDLTDSISMQLVVKLDLITGEAIVENL